MEWGFPRWELHQKQIVWKFNPAVSPHCGDSWEWTVMTRKQAMYHVLNGQSVTDELLAIILRLAEQLLISCPLTFNSSDPTILEVLKLHHFLPDWPSFADPHLLNAREHQSQRKMVDVAQAQIDYIRARWLKKYLPVLEIRQKRYKKTFFLKKERSGVGYYSSWHAGFLPPLTIEKAPFRKWWRFSLL